MPSRRRSRADLRKPSDKEPSKPFLDRRSDKPRDIEISTIEKGSNLGLIVKNELVAENILPLREAFRKVIGREHIRRVVVNLSAVPYMDTAAAGMLADANRELKAAGKELILVNLQPRVQRFFDILNLQNAFDIRRLQ
ncbi:MAG: hypothetical protein Kow0059_00720 [Candidatus Sumerlaeia bacterium]